MRLVRRWIYGALVNKSGGRGIAAQSFARSDWLALGFAVALISLEMYLLWQNGGVSGTHFKCKKVAPAGATFCFRYFALCSYKTG